MYIYIYIYIVVVVFVVVLKFMCYFRVMHTMHIHVLHPCYRPAPSKDVGKQVVGTFPKTFGSYNINGAPKQYSLLDTIFDNVFILALQQTKIHL